MGETYDDYMASMQANSNSLVVRNHLNKLFFAFIYCRLLSVKFSNAKSV